MDEPKKPLRRYVPGSLNDILAGMGTGLKEKRLKADAERKAARERGETVPEKPSPVTRRPEQPTPTDLMRAQSARAEQEKKPPKPPRQPKKFRPSYPKRRGKFL